MLVVLVIILIIGGVFVSLQLPQTRQWYLDYLQQQLAQQEIKLKITSMRGIFPFHFSLGHVSVSDNKDTWLEIDHVALNISFSALFHKKILFQSLQADKVALYRLPDFTHHSPVPAKPAKTDFSLDSIRLPLALHIQQFVINTLILGTPVLFPASTHHRTSKQPSLSMSIAGNTVLAQGKLVARSQQLQLSVKHLGMSGRKTATSKTNQLDVKLGYRSDTRHLSLSLQGFLSARLFQRFNTALHWPSDQKLLPGDIQIQLQADAPIDHYQGRIKLEFSNLGKLNLGFTTDWQSSKQQILLTLDSELHTTPIVRDYFGLPDGLDILHLQGKTVLPLSTRVALIDIQTLDLQSRLAKLQFSGHIDTRQQQLALDGKLNLPDLQLLQSKLAQPISGSAQLGVQIHGKWTTPKITYQLLARNLAQEAYRIRHVQINGQTSLDQKIRRNSLSAQINDLLVVKQQVSIPAITLNSTFSLQNLRQLKLQKLDLRTSYGNLQGSGALDIRRLEGQFKLKQDIEDLAQLKSIWQNLLPANTIKTLSLDTLQGQQHLQIEVNIAKQANQIHLALQSQLADLSGLQPDLSQWLGRQIQIHADILLTNKTHLTLMPGKIQFAGGEIDWRGVLVLPQAQTAGQIDINLNTQLHSLRGLQAFTGTPVFGQIKQQLQLRGDLFNPDAQLEIQASNLRYQQTRVTQLNAWVQADTLARQPKGKVNLHLEKGKHFIDLSSDFLLKNSKLLRVDNFLLRAPKSEIQANLQADLQQRQFKANISGRVKDLQQLQFIHQQAGLHGDITFNAEINKAVSWSVVSKKLSLADVMFANLDWQGRLKHWQDWQQGKMALENVLQIAHIQFQQQGKPYDACIKIHNQGRLKNLQTHIQINDYSYPDTAKFYNKKLKNKADPFAIDKLPLQLSITARSGYTPQSGNVFLSLESVQGKLLAKDLRMSKHWTMKGRLNPQNYQLQNLNWQATDLAWDKAVLQIKPGQLDTNKQQINARMVLDLPLSLLTQLTDNTDSHADIQGQGRVDLVVTRALSRPEIRLNGYIKELAFTRNRQHQTMAINLEAMYQKNMARASLAITGVSPKPLQLQAGIPVKITLQPFELTVLKHKPLSGKVAADLNLWQLQQFYLLDQQQVKGQAKLALDLGGTLHQPQINGALTLKKGFYANEITGTVLQNIDLDVALHQSELHVKHLRAEDFDQGKMSGNGALRWSDSRQDHIKYDFFLDLQQIKLINQDETNLQLSGQIHLQGDQAQALLKSRIHLDRGEYILPDATAVDIPQIQVVETSHDQARQKQDKIKKGSVDHADFSLRLDSVLTIPSQMYIRGRGLDSEWYGKITLQGQVQNPQLEGFLSVKRGDFNFLNKRFVFKKGKVSFVGALPPRPRLDFELSARAKDMTGILTITGLAEKPKIKLSSQPSLPDDEILARLLFNKDISKLSTFETIQLASAVRTLATGGSGFMDKTRNTLGVDTLDFKGDDGTGSGSSVTVGKHISDNVFVEVESSMTSGSKVKVEMDVSDKISVESRVDQKSNTGFGINWKFDY